MIFSGIRYEGLRVLDIKKTDVEYTETLDDEMSKALTESVNVKGINRECNIV